MDIAILAVKYVFVAAVTVEGILIARALWSLARDKAAAASAAPAPAQE